MYCKCIISTLYKLYYLSNDVLHTYVLQCIRFTPVNMSGRSPPLSPPPHRACVVMSFLVQSIVCELYECCKHECWNWILHGIQFVLEKNDSVFRLMPYLDLSVNRPQDNARRDVMQKLSIVTWKYKTDFLYYVWASDWCAVCIHCVIGEWARLL